MESGFSVQRKPTCRTSESNSIRHWREGEWLFRAAEANLPNFGIYSNTSLDWREGEWLFRAAEANLPNLGIYSNTSLERWVSG